MTIKIDYQKRKNLELFKCLEEQRFLHLSKTQNYIPIYNNLMVLNDTNYNNVNLNHKWYISSIKDADSSIPNLYNCRIKNTVNQKTKDKEVFFKMAPLLDPFRFLTGKYNAEDFSKLKLPDHTSNETNTHPKLVDTNNSAYVDGFFLFANSFLIHDHGFIHGVDYYGSFLAIKNNFKVNIFDDLDFLNESEFFLANKNILFKTDNYDHLLENDNKSNKKPPIKIQSAKSNISIQSLDDDIFENLFDDGNTAAFSLDEVSIFELESEFNTDVDDCKNAINTLRSSSSCSSRSSHTSNEDEVTNDDDNNDTKSINSDSDNSDSCDSFEEENIEATILQFPVEVICMEYCENTFDDLILSEKLKKEEWLSALMQIIMILITYQKSFSFTHNDLHTNNVMYNSTDKKFIYYRYNNKQYKVPTFGRLFKMIDFGRSIYKVNGNLYCSDSFKTGGDAATQYNTEPYFNDKKPRLEPNFSFDLCRLACSIFDYIIKDVKSVNRKDPIQKIINEWCLDDNGVHMLYKNNGEDRYPDFKLYKMIARFVHNHTPNAQLERPEFKAFEFNGEMKGDVVDIDQIHVYV